MHFKMKIRIEHVPVKFYVYACPKGHWTKRSVICTTPFMNTKLQIFSSVSILLMLAVSLGVSICLSFYIKLILCDIFKYLVLYLLLYTEDFISNNTTTLDNEMATNQIVSFVLKRQVMFWDFQQSGLLNTHNKYILKPDLTDLLSMWVLSQS